MKKKNNPNATTLMKKMIGWLADQGIGVMVEPDVYEEIQPCAVTTWREEVSTCY